MVLVMLMLLDGYWVLLVFSSLEVFGCWDFMVCLVFVDCCWVVVLVVVEGCDVMVVDLFGLVSFVVG